jgi:hypothetical protein
MYEQMEVVDKYWLARGYNSSDILSLPLEVQLCVISCSGNLGHLWTTG